MRPEGTAFEPDEDGLTSVLDSYDRCLMYNVSDSGKVTVTSGKHPHWRRFQRDLHGPTVNIQGHGYAIEHVHKRKMLTGEGEKDPDVEPEEWYPYEDRPTVTIITLTPIIDLINEGREGPDIRP